MSGHTQDELDAIVSKLDSRPRKTHGSRLPLEVYASDTLKVDRSLVIDLPGETNSRAIVRAIIAMAHTPDLEVLAEGQAM